MRKFIDFFIERPLIVNLLSVLILLVGFFTVWNLQKEIFPKIDFDIVVISTAYPGSSPEDVEKLVSIPLERSLKGVAGIKTLNSMSSEGSSLIYAEIDPDYELDDVFSDIKSAIDTVDDLPDDATRPIVKQPDSKMRSVITVTLSSSSLPYKELRRVGKMFRDRLEREKFISKVNLGGYFQDEVRVEIDLDKLNRYELTATEVANAIQGRNLNLSAGKIEVNQREVFIRTIAEFIRVEDIANIVVRSNSMGHNVKISDFAKVVRVPMKADILERSGGRPAIFFSISISDKADIIHSVNRIKQVTQNFLTQKKLKEVRADIKSEYINDLSYYVKRRLNVLKDNGITGMLLVFLALMLFLNFRTSLITSFGAPIAFMFAFIAMESMGMSLNLITMFALILVLGMLVDDSIIVAEQFYQKLEKGVAPKQAAKEAAWETFYPVLSTVLTTIVAFSSLFFMGGMMGKFLWSVPVVVIIALVGSLLECFLILPSHLADFVKLKKDRLNRNRWYQPLLKIYKHVLAWALRAPWVTFIIFIIALVLSLSLISRMRFELFPGDDVRIAYIFVKGPVGVTLERTDRQVKKLEKLALSTLHQDELAHIVGNVGIIQKKKSDKRGNQYGQVILFLTEPTVRKRNTDEIIVDLTKRLRSEIDPEYEVSIRKVQGGPPKGKAFEVEFSGDDLEMVFNFVNEVKLEVEKIDGVTSVSSDYESGKEQIIVDINDREARRLGLTTRMVATELRTILGENALTEIRENDEDIDVKLVLSSKQIENSIRLLNKLYVLNKQGRRIKISRVAKFTKMSGPAVIRRLDRKRIISLSGTLDKRKLSPLGVVKKIKPIVLRLKEKYPDVYVTYGGENKDTRESMLGLAKAAIISLMLIFFILVVMFSSLAQPLIVMTAIPFGIGGVVLTFFLFGQPLGFMAAMGAVALTGVVVNDSIVLVNFINTTRQEISDVGEAVFKAAESRFRPILLTTVTTVAGLMPIAHATGGDPFLKPMALSFAYGLAFSTAVTLIFIPVLYILYVRISGWFRWKLLG